MTSTTAAPTPDLLQVFTPATLAARWGTPWTEARVRRLCREGYIPAKKIGPKLWLIPAVGLAASIQAIVTQPQAQAQPVTLAPAPANVLSLDIPRKRPGRRPKKIAYDS